MITDRWIFLFRSRSLDSLSHDPAVAKDDPSSCNNEAAGDDLPADSPEPPFQLDAGWRPWKVVMGCFFFTVPIYGLLSSIGLAFSSNYGGLIGCLAMGGVCAGMQHFLFRQCLGS